MWHSYPVIPSARRVFSAVKRIINLAAPFEALVEGARTPQNKKDYIKKKQNLHTARNYVHNIPATVMLAETHNNIVSQ